MKEFSQEKIEIAGKEYTLFLNRKGVVAFETFGRQEQQKLSDLTMEALNINKELETKECDGNVNPFEDKEVDKIYNLMEEETKTHKRMYQKMYWILLYTNHQLSQEKVNELYDLACKEYGEEQLIQLADQIVDDVNRNIYQKEENDNNLKKLTALRPKK